MEELVTVCYLLTVVFQTRHGGLYPSIGGNVN